VTPAAGGQFQLGGGAGELLGGKRAVPAFPVVKERCEMTVSDVGRGRHLDEAIG